MIRFTMLYDNFVYERGLQADWGFAALIETQDHALLFDTGADGMLLLSNMAALGIDPARIDAVIFSHLHSDHTGGASALYAAGARPQAIYVLPSFPAAFKRRAAQVAEVIEVKPGSELVPGIVSTGELLIGPTPEHALVINTANGAVLLTGCAHPGIVPFTREAVALTSQPVRLVMGGFHLLNRPPDSLAAIIHDLHELGVTHAAPTHCTGGYAISQFKDAFGDNCIPLGVGRMLEFPMPLAVAVAQAEAA
jgi:7,8-dihydropterin-6-yl-methyl-4-(beta-D-ribofuranosyl)aminobenzene 5'-phosphate synthase